MADARDSLADDPTLVVAARRFDGERTDVLAAVRSGEHCDPSTPVLELVESDDSDARADAEASADVDTDVDTEESATAATDDTDDETSASAGDDFRSAFDDRISLADPDAFRTAVRLAIAVREYREATATLYDLSRRRSDGDLPDTESLDDARRVANDRLTAVQRAAAGRTPFRRLLSE